MLWLWGLGGAFCYAGPRLLKDIQDGKPWKGSTAEGVLALILGTIFTVSFEPLIAYHFPWLAKPNCAALSVSMGLCANPASPLIVRRVLKEIKTRGSDQ